VETPDLSKLKIEQDRRGLSRDRKAARSKGRWIAALAVLTIVFGAVAWWKGWLSRPTEVTAVKVSVTYPSRCLTILNASGYVVAQRKAAVSSKATGRLEKLFIEEGKFVKEGEVLAQLENDDLEATLEEAKALLRVARAAQANAEAELVDATLNFDRIKSLKLTGAVSQQAYDTAEARYRKAVAMDRSGRFGVERGQAAVKVAEVNLEYSLIRAPFDGVILTKSADEGEVVAPFGAATNAKAAVATMADLNSLMVEVDVAESSLEKVKVGATTEIRLDALPNERFAGTVHMIVPTADRSKATVLTKVKFAKLDKRVLPEMSAKVAFLARALSEGENKPFLGIPSSALRKTEAGPMAFIVNQGRAHAMSVQTGSEWGETVQVISGLKEGDMVVLHPGAGLRDRARVNVKE